MPTPNGITDLMLTPRKPNLRGFYTSLRNNLHGTFSPTADMETPNIHREAMKGYTNQLSQYVEPELAASLMDIPGYANETAAGMLTPTLPNPKPFFDKQGFDWADIAQNKEGQNLAIQDQNQQPLPMSRLIAEQMNPIAGALGSTMRYMKGRR